jgi:hypothetical protein
VGQQIRLGIPQASILRGAALVYVLPLFCLLLGALLGQLWLAPLLVGGGGRDHPQLSAGRHHRIFTGSLLFCPARARGIWSPHARGGTQYPSPLLSGAGFWPRRRRFGAEGPPDKALFLVPAD